MTDPNGWRPIADAPRDGTPFMAWGLAYKWPEIIRWEDYDEESRQETGEDGYFTYAEELVANAADPIDEGDLTHWQPLPAPPAQEEVKP